MKRADLYECVHEVVVSIDYSAKIRQRDHQPITIFSSVSSVTQFCVTVMSVFVIS